MLDSAQPALSEIRPVKTIQCHLKKIFVRLFNVFVAFGILPLTSCLSFKILL